MRYKQSCVDQLNKEAYELRERIEILFNEIDCFKKKIKCDDYGNDVMSVLSGNLTQTEKENHLFKLFVNL